MSKPVIKLQAKTKLHKPTPLKQPDPNISVALTRELEEMVRQSKEKESASKLNLEHYRPKKKQISIRMDVDVLTWFQSQPGKYQKLINQICRRYMEEQST